jgi:hypothetical protein
MINVIALKLNFIYIIFNTERGKMATSEQDFLGMNVYIVGSILNLKILEQKKCLDTAVRQRDLERMTAF